MVGRMVFHSIGPQYEYDRFVISSTTRGAMNRSEEDARVGLIAIPLLIVIKSVTNVATPSKSMA